MGVCKPEPYTLTPSPAGVGPGTHFPDAVTAGIYHRHADDAQAATANLTKDW